MRNLTEIETSMVAVERIKEFEEYPIEASWSLLQKNLPRNWPQSGGIQFIDYKLRYDENLDLVLKGLTFSVKGGEKVAILHVIHGHVFFCIIKAICLPNRLVLLEEQELENLH